MQAIATLRGQRVILAMAVALGACANTPSSVDAQASLDRPLNKRPATLDVVIVMSLGEDGPQFSARAGMNIARVVERLLAPPDGRAVGDFHLGVVTSKIVHGSVNMPPGCEAAGEAGSRHPHNGYLVQPSQAGGLSLNAPTGWPAEWEWPPRWNYLKPEHVDRVPPGQMLATYLMSASATEANMPSGAAACNVTEYLEVARMATDGRNGDFIRPDSLLVIVFLANWEDCSTDDASLWATSLWSTQYRYSNSLCYRPPEHLLYPVTRSLDYFSTIHSAGRMLIGLVGTESQPVWTQVSSPPLALAQPICSTTENGNTVVPTLRIPELMRGLAAQSPTVESLQFDPCAVYQSTDVMLPLADRILQILSR